jgi:hypothetical protein
MLTYEITETDIDWDAELRAELAREEEREDERRRFYAEVASCCQGRSVTCGEHYGHGS